MNLQRFTLAASLVVVAASFLHAQQRSLLDVLKPGQQLTLTKSNGRYAVRIYTAEEKKVEVEVNQLQSHAAKSERLTNNVIRARSQELSARLRAADAADRAALIEEMRRISTSSRGSARFSTRSVRPLEFHEVVEIGNDFFAVRRGNKKTHIALTSLEQITLTEGDEDSKSTQLNDQLARTQLQVLSRMVKVYQFHIGQLPTSAQGLTALIRPPMDLKDVSLWNGPYYPKKEVPRDPWGNTFAYELNNDERSKTQSVQLRSKGPDGEANTKDDLIESVNLTTPSTAAGRRVPARGGFGRGRRVVEDPFGAGGAGGDPFRD